MSANFYELLKYAATGIASPSMTYYDRMRASTLMGGVVQTMTGQTPLTFKADGTPLISWSMKGNGSQTGAPTPDNPVMPEFVGVRTGNLWNYTIEQGGWSAAAGTIPSKIIPDDPKFTIRCRVGYMIPIPSNTMSLTCPSGIKINFVWINTNGVSLGGSGWQQNGSTVTAPENATSMTFILGKVDDSTCSPNDFQNIMLNSGSTALPYEPFGWAVKLTCAGQTVPVYLGQTQTVRRIKKYVFTGNENTQIYSGAGLLGFEMNISDMMTNSRTLGVSTHFKPQITGSGMTTDGITFGANNKTVYVTFSRNTIDTFSLTDISTIKSWLAAQYAAGTPVTVWYVLATPETAIVNEPLAKIATYADELHSEDAAVTIPTAKGQNTLTVDTPIQPSEMTITFKG